MTHTTAGETTLPATAGDEGADKKAASLDPMADKLAAVIAHAITEDAGPLWAPIVASLAAGSPERTRLAGTSIIERTTPRMVTEGALLTRGAKYPALFVGRKPAQTRARHFAYRWRLVQDWDVTWLVGPLVEDNVDKLEEFFQRAAPLAIERVCERWGHPTYNPDPDFDPEDENALLGARLWSTNELWSLDFVGSGFEGLSVDQGQAQGQMHFACVATIRTAEIIRYEEPDGVPLGTMTATIHEGDDPDDEDVGGRVEFEADAEQD